MSSLICARWPARCSQARGHDRPIKYRAMQSQWFQIFRSFDKFQGVLKCLKRRWKFVAWRLWRAWSVWYLLNEFRVTLVECASSVLVVNVTASVAHVMIDVLDNNSNVNAMIAISTPWIHVNLPDDHTQVVTCGTTFVTTSSWVVANYPAGRLLPH